MPTETDTGADPTTPTTTTTDASPTDAPTEYTKVEKNKIDDIKKLQTLDI